MSEIIDPSQIGKKPSCPYCHKQLAHISSVNRHMKDGSCRVQNPNSSKKELIKSNNDRQLIIETMGQKFDKFTEKIEKSIEKGIEAMKQQALITPSLISSSPAHISNNHLNILCVGKNDNLLDMLSSAEGIANALTYMKDCVLAQLAGDCRILERAYKLDTEQAAIMYANKSKTKYCYYDERRRLTVEGNAAVMAKKLAGILQRSYLKGMEGFKTNILGEKRECISEDMLNVGKMPELEAYDIHLWNEHVQRLADEKYQKKVLRSLKIPMAPPEK
jgi:hypothetical protein